MKIKSIKKIDYKSKRYDIEVADNHNLFADNILVHNCQNLTNKLSEWLTKPIYYSEKLEGSSISIYVLKNQDVTTENPDEEKWIYGVCSRNLELKLTHVNDDGVEVPVENRFVNTAKKLNMKSKMIEWCEKHGRDALVLQGELIGEGVQGNIYKLIGNDIGFFTAQDGKQGRLDIEKIAEEIDVKTAPILENNIVLTSDLNKLLKLAEGKSQLNPKQEREGIVIRAMDNSFSFKVISNKYLLKQKN